MLVWRLAVRGARWSLRELLPSHRQGLIVGGLLAGLYLILGLTLRTASLPRTLIPHVTALAIYAVLIFLLILNLRRSPTVLSIGDAAEKRSISLLPLVIFMAVFLTGAVVLAPFKWADFIAILVTWIIGCILGAFLLALSVRRAFSHSRGMSASG